MTDNQPTNFDTVLEGKTAPLITDTVLGGLEGVKNRLNSSIIEVQTAALRDAINYGDAGLDLIREALQNLSLQRFARRLLKHQKGTKVKQALLNYNSW